MSDDVDNLSRLRSEMEAQIDAKCPPGWSRAFVEQPWKGQAVRCRSCGLVHASAPGDVRWSNATIFCFDEERKVMRFSFAMVCDVCIKDESRMKLLADRVFVAH